jgi:hypothetical protein
MHVPPFPRRPAVADVAASLKSHHFHTTNQTQTSDLLQDNGNAGPWTVTCKTIFWEVWRGGKNKKKKREMSRWMVSYYSEAWMMTVLMVALAII